MLRLTLARDIKATMRRCPEWFRTSSPNFYRFSTLHVARLSENSNVQCMRSSKGQDKIFRNYFRTSLMFERSFQTATRVDGRLLHMFETLQRDKKAKSKKNQLFASFNLVRKIQSETDVEELLEIYDTLKSERNFQPDEMSVLSARVALLTRFAVLSTRQTGKRIVSDGRVKTAAEKLLNSLKWNSAHCEATHLASVLWSVATLGISEKSYFIHLEREIKGRDPKLFNNADLAMILWALGKAQFRAPQLFRIIRDEIMDRDLSGFKVKEICHILWSYARTLEKGAKLFSAFKEEIMRRDLSEFEERSLVIILWSFSEVGLNVKPLFRVIKLEVLRRGLPCFTEKQLAQIVSSYATQDIRSPDLFQEISAEIIDRGILGFEPVGIVMVASSFAKTKNYIWDLFKLIERHLMAEDLSVFQPLEVVRLLRSFTDAGVLKEELLHKLTDQILLCNFAQLNDTSLGELVQALEECHFEIPELVAATEAELVRRSEAQE